LYRSRGGRLQAEVIQSLAPSVYIASDIRLYREALASGLAADGALCVAGQGPCAQALRDLTRLRPDVLLLDLASPNSLAVPRAAVAIAPALRVVAFAVSEVEADVLACAEAGICAYVGKEGTVDEVVATIQRALSGELVCPPRIAALLFNRVAKLAAGGLVSDTILTTREQEIAGLLAHGLSNKLIARRLGPRDRQEPRSQRPPEAECGTPWRDRRAPARGGRLGRPERSLQSRTGDLSRRYPGPGGPPAGFIVSEASSGPGMDQKIH
jgi:DNA-binding NarL/FixJ family response regulator